MTLNSLVVHRADKYAAQGNARMVRLMNQYGSQIVPFLVYFVPSFAAMYVGSQGLGKLMAIIPPQFISALSVTGGLIPALGIGILLTYIWDKKFFSYFVIGFFLVAYLNLGVMFIAILGGCLAALHIYNANKEGVN
jgi:mannose/fructose/N-acetylgalactosamine-specific phosphotransferase system component IIC